METSISPLYYASNFENMGNILVSPRASVRASVHPAISPFKKKSKGFEISYVDSLSKIADP